MAVIPSAALRRLGVVATVVLLAAVLWYVAVAHSKPSDEPVASPPELRYSWVIDAADVQGAVIGRVSSNSDLNEAVGVSRAGKRVWRVMPGDNQPLYAVCVQRCPDAVLSGSLATAGQPETADPDLSWVTGGHVQRLPSGIPTNLPGKEVVFAALSRSVFIAQRADLHGRNQVHLADPRHSVELALPAGADATVWADPMLGHALVGLTSVATRQVTVTWLVRGAHGWQQVGVVKGVDAQNGCISDDGLYGMLLGSKPMLVDLSSARLPTVGFQAAHAGNCAFTSSGPVLLSNSVSASGQHAVLTQFTPEGKQMWSRSLAKSTTLSADQSSADVVVSTSGLHPRVLLLRGDGSLARTIAADSGVVAGPDLVTVDRQGTVTWTPLPK